MYNTRILNLRKKILDNRIDAALISNSSNVRYFSGFSGSEADLVLTKDKTYLFCDSRYSLQAGIECPHVEVVNTAEGIYNVLNRIILNESIRTIGFEERSLSVAAYNTMSKSIQGATLIPIGGLATDFRIIKDENEIALLKRAAWIADRAYSHVVGLINPGMKETEIAAELEYSMRKDGAEAISFKTIVASGQNSAKPHGTASEKPVEIGDFIVLDFGCVYKGYCSDITRTVALGKISDAQKNLYNSVLFVQTKMLSLIHSGMKCIEADAIARRYFSLFGCEKYFAHSLGHGVGLDIHEQPTLGRSSTLNISDNVVVTVEPGLYIDGLYGVRIEDTVVFSSVKPYILTNSAKELTII